MPDLLYAILAGLLAGMIPTAVIVARLMKLPDPRSYGSKNPGATNVMRTGNKHAGIMVFLIDYLKGFGPALACGLLLIPTGLAAVTAFLAVVAHAWNPLLKFRGGRGVATGFGGLFAVDWRLGTMAAAMWGLVYSMSKTVSLASVFSFIAAMLLAAWLYPYGSYMAAGTAGIAMVVIIRHRQHLMKLAGGGEDKFTAGKPDHASKESKDGKG